MGARKKKQQLKFAQPYIKALHKKLRPLKKYEKKYQPALFIVAFGVIGAAVLFFAHAAVTAGLFEPEQGTLAGNATLVNDSSASNGAAVQFNAPPAPPAPTPKYDLVITNVGVTNDAVVGKGQQIWADVKNIGTATAPGNYGVNMYVNNNQETWGWVDGPLAPNTTIRVTGTGIMPNDPSSFWYPSATSANISALADSTNGAPNESDENNNSYQKSIAFGVEVNATNTPVSTTSNAAWCGPPWDAPQEEFNLAAQDGIGILGPPCQAGGGFVPQTVEQNNIAMNKAAAAGTKILVFGGYLCNDPYNYACYKMYSDPNAVLDQYPVRTGMAGFFVVDEPPFEGFNQIAAVNQTVARRRPGLLSFTNIFGNVIGSSAGMGLGCAPNKCPITYQDYVWNYINITRPQIISSDDYEASNVVYFRTTSVILTQRNSLRDDNGVPAAPIMTAVPSVTIDDTLKAPNALWLRYLDLKPYALTYGSILHFTWRTPPGASWYGEGECGVSRSQLHYSGTPICGY